MKGPLSLFAPAAGGMLAALVMAPGIASAAAEDAARDAHSGAAQVAVAPSATDDAKSLAPDVTRSRFSGYVIATGGAFFRPGASPLNQSAAGLTGLTGGLRLEGEPYDHWRYALHLEIAAGIAFGGNQYSGLEVDAVPVGPDGRVPFVSKRYFALVNPEEITLSYAPIAGLDVRAGQMRIPFSVGQGATQTAQMFVGRPGPAEAFLTGADQGAVLEYTGARERVTVKAGAFNGSSLNLAVANTATVGPTYSGFVDVHPLGRMPPVEGDSVRGPFRLGVGVGALLRLGTLYDSSGYQATKFRDLRFSAALRAAFYGVFLQGEYLRHQQTDALSSRPDIDTGAYVQGAYYIPVASQKVAFQPIARVGTTLLNQEFAEEKITSVEAGLAFFPRSDLPDPSSLRLRLEYAYERRLPEATVSHAVLANAQIKW